MNALILGTELLYETLLRGSLIGVLALCSKTGIHSFVPFESMIMVQIIKMSIDKRN